MRYYPLLCKDSVVRAILDSRQTQDRRPIRAAGNDVHIDRLLGEWPLSIPPYQYTGLRRVGGGTLPWNWQGKKKPERYDWIWELQYAVDDSASIPIRSPYGKPGDRLWVRETWQAEHCGVWWHDAKSYTSHPSALNWNLFYRADSGDFNDDVPRWIPSIHMPRWACRIELNVLRVWVERVQDVAWEDMCCEGIPAEIENTQHIPNVAKWFRGLWDSIYSKSGYGWNVNPWVWACEFEVVK